LKHTNTILMLKTPLLQKLPLSKDSSFIFERYVSPNFETPWHYHEEIEIVLCEVGFGKKIVGNHTSEYQPSDLMLLGSNLPHWFRADDSFYTRPQILKPTTVVIQFRKESFGEQFFSLTEMTKVKEIFEKSQNGIEFYGHTRQKINQMLISTLQEEGLKRLIGLLEIIYIMSTTKEYRLLSEIGMVGVSLKDAERMNIIIDHIFNKFTEDIDLNVLSDKVGMSTAAFCRYFKSRTQKTFIEYLNEIKISHACKLLRETEQNIVEICFDSGFNNLSNFNRQFRKVTQTNPHSYRKSIG
jgi:AraC-like DNA-binding protein